MRRAAFLVALLLAACTAQPDPTRAPSRTFAPGTEAVYLKLAGELLPTWTDARLQQEAGAVCDTLDEHPDATGWVQAVQRLAGEGLSGHDAGALIGYATGTLCPERADVGGP